MLRITSLVAILGLVLAAAGCNTNHASTDSAGSESYDKMNNAAGTGNGGPPTGQAGGELGTNPGGGASMTR